MFWSTPPDTCSRADLLTYLVVSQLLRHRLTGKWLTTEHAVESTHLWMSVNGRHDLLARVSLAGQAEVLAAQILSVSKVRLDAKKRSRALSSNPLILSTDLRQQQRFITRAWHTSGRGFLR